MTLGGCHLRWRHHYSVIASKVVVVVSEMVAEVAFRMKLPGMRHLYLQSVPTRTLSSFGR